VGRHLADALSREHQVIQLNRRATGADGEIVHDLGERLPTKRLPGRINAVVHAAGLLGRTANSSPLCRRVNVEATRELADYAALAGSSHFVLCSTGGVYLPTAQVLHERSAVAPQDAYGDSKAAAETIVQSYAQAFAAQILRLFFPFGPGQKGRLIANFIEEIDAGRSVTLMNSSGQPLLTPVYIDDLVEYVRRVLNISAGFVANIGGNEVVSIRELAEMIGKALGRNPTFEITETSGTPCNWWGDSSYISQLTDYSPQVSLAQGLERTIAKFIVARAGRS